MVCVDYEVFLFYGRWQRYLHLVLGNPSATAEFWVGHVSVLANEHVRGRAVKETKLEKQKNEK